MALLDVNALVAVAWDSHIHHARMRGWFADNAAGGWATCPVTESGLVTFDAALVTLAQGRDVELMTTL